MVTELLGEKSAFDTMALLVFEIDGQTYGLPVDKVARIIDMVTIIQLPDMPYNLKGIIDLQGKGVPVMDMRARFGLPLRDYGLHTPIILAELNGHGHMLGLIVDTVEDVLEVSKKDLEIIDTFLPSELIMPAAKNSHCLAGVAKTNGEMVLILDLASLVSTADQATIFGNALPEKRAV